MSILEVVNVSREVSWLPRAVEYFFLIGISCTSFLMSMWSSLRGGERVERFGRLALIAALTCGLVAPFALLADLHQPGRFWHFYAYPNFGSWMAWGAFFIPGYLGGLLLYAFAWWRPNMRLLRPVAWFTALFAGLILLYTGMEVMVVRARPLWDTPLLPVQFAVTAFTGAAGLVLLFDRFMAGRDAATETLAARWLMASLVMTIIVGMIWFALAYSGASGAHARALASVASHQQWQLTAAWAAAATLAPLAILWMKPVGLGWFVGLIAIHAAWMFRWTVFIGGQTVPKTGAGLYVYHLPLGHDGLLGIAGTFGLWVAALVVISTVLGTGRSAPRPALAPAP
jgi:tetrathionate reductase subunit C